jgi:hypothetical protein
MVTVGWASKLYYNSAAYDTPTWVEIPIARDVKVTMTADEADVTTRGALGWKQMIQGLRELSFEFQIVHDPEDEVWEYLRSAFWSNTPIDLWAADQVYSDADAQGPRGVCAVFGFDKNEALSEGVVHDLVAKNTYSEDPPTWHENPS